MHKPRKITRSYQTKTKPNQINQKEVEELEKSNKNEQSTGESQQERTNDVNGTRSLLAQPTAKTPVIQEEKEAAAWTLGGGDTDSDTEPTHWTCPACTYQNRLTTAICGICDTLNPECEDTDDPDEGCKQLPGWSCTCCTFVNPPDRTDCEICGHEGQNIAEGTPPQEHPAHVKYQGQQAH